jgi:hypothetical protein
MFSRAGYPKAVSYFRMTVSQVLSGLGIEQRVPTGCDKGSVSDSLDKTS